MVFLFVLKTDNLNETDERQTLSKTAVISHVGNDFKQLLMVAS